MNYYVPTTYSNPYETVTTLYQIAFVLAIAAAVLCFIFILPEKRRASLNGFFCWIADIFDFKALLIEKILKFVYITLTVCSIVGGLLILTYSPFADYANGEIAVTALAMIVVVPIIIRIIHELFMLAILAVKNIIAINNKLKSQSDENVVTPFDQSMGLPKKQKPEYSPAPAAPVAEPFAPQAAPASQDPFAPQTIPTAPEPFAPQTVPAYRFCTECGTKYDANLGGCPRGCKG